MIDTMRSERVGLPELGDPRRFEWMLGYQTSWSRERQHKVQPAASSVVLLSDQLVALHRDEGRWEAIKAGLRQAVLGSQQPAAVRATLSARVA